MKKLGKNCDRFFSFPGAAIEQQINVLHWEHLGAARSRSVRFAHSSARIAPLRLRGATRAVGSRVLVGIGSR